MEEEGEESEEDNEVNEQRREISQSEGESRTINVIEKITIGATRVLTIFLSHAMIIEFFLPKNEMRG